MTFTPVQGPEAALDEAVAVGAGAEVVGWVAAGVEQAARVNRRPAAAKELAAAVRILVKVTCQAYGVAGQQRDAVALCDVLCHGGNKTSAIAEIGSRWVLSRFARVTGC